MVPMIHPWQYNFSDIDNRYISCPDNGPYTRPCHPFIKLLTRLFHLFLKEGHSDHPVDRGLRRDVTKRNCIYVSVRVVELAFYNARTTSWSRKCESKGNIDYLTSQIPPKSTPSNVSKIRE